MTRDPDGTAPAGSDDDGPQARQRDRAARMDRLIAALPAGERDVLVLRLVRRCSVEETAARLGATPTGVLVAQHRALDRLRAAVAGPQPG